MNIKFPLILIILTILAMACTTPEEPKFVEVDGTRFVIDGEPYTFVGTNFWFGAYLGAPGEIGDRDRLIRELDLLRETGITNLRILAASEEAGHSRALTPSFLNADGEVNEDLLQGLDFLLAEMAKRDMRAVVFLNNFWEWSGGMTVYGEWFGGEPTFDPGETNEWVKFMNQSAQFYYNEAAQTAWRDYIRKVITRTNTVNGKTYNEDPVIMSWQLANEPRPGHGDEAFANADIFITWVDESSAYIKSLAPRQLVSTGNEGTMGSLESEEIYLAAHRSPHVDYMTFHMWAKNWGWFDAEDMEGTFPVSLQNAEAYIRQHAEYARMLNKPTVLSEFGLGRDYERFEIGTPVTYRDHYLGFVFGLLEEKMKAGSPVAGSNFWTWGGYGVPQHEDSRWRPGDPFVGDPPQEPQGLNSVFATDESTLEVIRNHHDTIQAISRGSYMTTAGNTAQPPEPKTENSMLYAKDNLVAWCIVPFDSENRDPAARAELLRELGFTRMAWDWRTEHLPQLAEEISVLRDNNIELSAVWFWLDNRSSTGLLEHHEHILNTLAESGAETTLWVSFDNDFFEGITDEEKVKKGAEVIGLIRSRATESGTRVALYNHGDWFGEPENQIRIIEATGADDIGLVYNFHHGHHQIENFPAMVEMMLPWLWTVNLNGMRQEGPKIMDIGKGDHEAGMMRILKESGFNGTIGIIGHTEGEDVRKPLIRNLDGLKQILAEIGDTEALATYR